MRQIWDFLRLVFRRQNVLKTDLKSPTFVPFVVNLTKFGAKSDITGQTYQVYQIGNILGQIDTNDEKLGTFRDWFSVSFEHLSLKEPDSFPIWCHHGRIWQ